MKKPIFRSRCASMAAAGLFCSLANAATISVSSTAPTVDSDDIANLATSTGGQSIWNDRPLRGQTFTTGSNSGGYELNSITFQLADPDADPGPANVIEGWKDYRVRVNTISGTTATPTVDVVVRYTPDAASNDYFTVVFDSPISLNASTLYGFDISISSSQDGWSTGIPSLLTTGNNYAGGQYYSSSANQNTYASNATATVSYSSGTDLVFELDLAVVPEPRAALLGGIGLLMLLRRRR